MRRSPLFLATVLLTLAAVNLSSARAADWPTFHGDATRQGADTSDPGLATPLAAWTSTSLDGEIQAQPLVIGSQVIVATENNTVYSLNSATGAITWTRHLGTPRTTAITCGNINPQGITSTPVVVGSNVYVVANIQTSSTSFYFSLTSIALSTGAVNWAANINPPDTSNPSGYGWSDEALTMEDRGALLATGGRIFVPMGGNDGDCGNYHGYVVSYPQSGSGTLNWWASTEVVPGDSMGATWATGGVTQDAAGSIFVATGNSNQTDSTGTYDYSDGVIKLDPAALAPGAPADYFAPSTWGADNATDTDLGSNSPLQLPGERILQIGKSGVGYLLNATSLGHIGGQLAAHQVCHATADAAFGSLAYAAGIAYVGCSDGMAAVRIASSGNDFTPLWYNTTDVSNHPPTVAGGLVWGIDTGGGTLLGFSSTTGALEESFPVTGSRHFTTPTAANNMLYVGGGTQVDAFAGAAPPPASKYVPLTPYRILDTRAATCVQCGAGAFQPAQTRTISVGGYTPPGYAGPTVPASATAVVLNLTSSQSSTGTFLTVSPAGGATPGTSNVNATPGSDIANLVTVPLGSSGAVAIYNATGTDHVIADVAGYYTAVSGTDGEFHAVSPPVRVCDTRGGQGTGCNSGTSRPLGPGEARLIAVTDGSTGVPTGGKGEAAVLNLTAAGPTAGTYLTAYPAVLSGGSPACGTAPGTSSVNVPVSVDRPNRVITPLLTVGGTGYVCIFNAAGSVNIAVDANGWFGDAADSGGALFHPVRPLRICDTRASQGTQCEGTTLGPQSTDVVVAAGSGVLPGSALVAIVGNLTATGGSAGTYLTLYPHAGAQPGTSDVNAPARADIANQVITAVAANGDVDISNAQGTTDAVLDISGWFQ